MTEPRGAGPETSARPDLLSRLDQGCAALTRRIAVVAVAGMLVISVLTIVDVTLRWLANRPIPGFYELSQLIIAIVITASFPAALATRNNLTIDFLAEILPARARQWLTVAGAVLIQLFLVLFAWRLAFHASELAARNAATINLEIPVAPFWYVAVGFVCVCILVQSVVLAVEGRALFAGRPPGPVPTGARGPRWLLLALIAVAVLSCTALFAAPVTHGPFADLIPSTPVGLAGLAFVALIALVLLQVPLAAALGLVGLVASATIMGGYNSGLVVFGNQSADQLVNLDLATIPLFIMMGGFASAAGLSAEIYRLAHTLIGHRAGGLAIATIGGCAGFGAVTGSSVATAATIGRVALPEMQARGYSARLSTGSIAAGGTLGMLIPPSTMIVIYAVLTNTSIGRLFIAAIVPAAVALFLYVATVWVQVRLRPSLGPKGEKASGREVAAALRGAWGVVLLFGIVIGGIYGGVFTATEAAAVGAGTAFVFAVVRRRRETGAALMDVLGDTAANTAMIYMLVIGALMFSFFIGVTQAPNVIVAWVGGLQLAPLAVVFLILLLYIFLGGIMDPITMLLVTVPVVVPLVQEMGYDLIWWGIMTVMVCEVAMITPPLGVNVFVIKTVAGDVPVRTVFAGVTPFVAVDSLRLLVLALFPILTLWLPRTMS